MPRTVNVLSDKAEFGSGEMRKRSSGTGLDDNSHAPGQTKSLHVHGEILTISEEGKRREGRRDIVVIEHVCSPQG